MLAIKYFGCTGENTGNVRTESQISNSMQAPSKCDSDIML
jgi:hypothetical protein